MPGNLDVALRIRADLSRAQQGLRELDRRLDGITASGRQAGRSMAGTARQVDRLDDAAGGASRRLTALRGGFVALGGLAAVRVLGDLVDGVARAGIELERLESRFRFATGSIAAGARELNFVRGEAARLGIDFGAAANAYSGLAAAAKGTRLTLEDTRQIFLGVAEAARVMGLDAEQTNGALLALEQILSKGKVSAEELRGQLGERLPGAFQIAARAMGVTTAELDRMLARGELVAEEFLPRFAAELRATFADDVPDAARTAAAEFARLANAIEELEQAVARSGLLALLGEAARLVAEILDRIGQGRRQGDLLGQFEELLELRGTTVPQPDSEAGRALMARIGARMDELETFLGQLSAEEAQLAAQLRDAFAARNAPLGDLINEFIARSANAPGRRLATDGAPAPAAAPAPDSESAAEKAAERAQQRIVAIEREEIDARLRLQQDFIALSLRREQRRIDEINALEQAGAVGGQAAERVRTAVRARGVAERARLASEAAAKELAREREITDAVKREHEARTRAADRARGELAVLERALLDPYERAVAEVRAWEAETVAAFERAGLSAEEYGETVAETVAERLARAAEEEAERRLRASTDWRAGAVRALRDYAAAATSAQVDAESATVSALGTMEDALVEFVTKGKVSFRSLTDSIVSDLARIAVQRSITGPLAGALGGLFGGGSQGGLSGSLIGRALAHGGGVVGDLRRYRTGVDPGVFAGARRYHRGGIVDGLRPEEIPIIARRGETIRTPEQERALASREAPRVEINFVNRGTAQREAGPPQTHFDGERLVIGVVVDDLDRGGPIRRSLQSLGVR